MSEIKIIEKKQDIRPLNLICCLPGNNFSGDFLRCWSEFLASCLMNNIRPQLVTHYDPVIYYCRNKCLGGDVLRGSSQKPYDGKVAYDYMLWIDSDVLFTFDDFVKLIQHNKDIVAGLYKTADGITFPVAVTWDIEFFKAHGYFEFLTEKDIENKKDLIEVSYTGFGFMLIKYGIFESLQYPWFRPITQKISETIEDFSSEDVSFCQLVKKNGYKVFVDPSVRVGHEKRLVLR